MAVSQVEIDGSASRELVKQAFPAATSQYTGAASARVYDGLSGLTLGEAKEGEYVVERAWNAAAVQLTPIERNRG